MKSVISIFVFIQLCVACCFSQDDKKAGRAAEADAEYFQTYLDSAEIYKKTDIETSIEFIAKALSDLNENGMEEERAQTLTKLGEIYQYHRQYDLAIANYRTAQEYRKSTRTTLLLAEVLLVNEDYTEAESVLTPLLDIKGMVPYQRVLLYEYLGDAYSGRGQTREAITYYEEGLVIAGKNRISPKIPDLNSKIADAYASSDRSQEASAYYGYSLEQAEAQAPQRAVREKEKVADFYNREGRYEDEINLRKKSLSTLKSLPEEDPTDDLGTILEDSITSQQINYKIANAYLAQDKPEEAIPYLIESIAESEDEDDLETQKEATRSLSELYREKGDYTRALETYQQYVAVVDTLYSRKEAEIAQAARFSREISSKQNRISSLEKDRQLSQSRFDLANTQQQLVAETNRRQKWLIYSLLLVIILTALAAFFFYRSNKQQKLANNLLALKSLRSQMNPHFIFNALNSVNSYIARNDEKNANKYLSDFSALMRSVLENNEEDFIPLLNELELIRIYLKLENARFPEKFTYEIDIPDESELKSFQIPPMLLQPYVENAVWHGLRYKEEKGQLKVAVRKISEDTVNVYIEDDGIGRKRSAELKTKHQSGQKSTGMRNIDQRIKILNSMNKDHIEVKVSDLNKDGTGTRVVVSIKRKI